MRQFMLSFLFCALVSGCGGGKAKDDNTQPTKALPPGPTGTPSPVVPAASRPATYPPNVPYYPGSTLVSSFAVPEQVLTLSTTDAPEKVANFFEEGFKKSGWKISGRVDMDKHHVMEAWKDVQRCALSINDSGDLTLIVLSLTKGEKKTDPKGEDPKEPKEPMDTRPKVGGVPLPKDFPGDIPVYPGSKATATTIIGDARSASFVTFDKAEKVTAFYQLEAKKQGWKQIAKTDEETTSVLILEKGNRVMTVTVQQDEGETLIALIVAEKS